MATHAVRNAAPEHLSPGASDLFEASDLFVAPSRYDSALGSLHRSNIALQDFMQSLDDLSVGSRADDSVFRASPASSARLCAFLDLAVNVADEQDLGATLQRIVALAAHPARPKSAALQLYDNDGLSGVSTYLHDTGVDFQGLDVAATFRVPIERGARCYGYLAVFESQSGPSSLDADDEALIRMLASFAACAIESAEVVAFERVCADVAADRTADDLRQVAVHELRAAVTAAQDEQRVEVSRKLGDEICNALDSVLLGLHRIGSPSDSSIEIPAIANPVDELRGLIAEALCRTRRTAFELRMLVADPVA